MHCSNEEEKDMHCSNERRKTESSRNSRVFWENMNYNRFERFPVFPQRSPAFRRLIVVCQMRPRAQRPVTTSWR